MSVGDERHVRGAGGGTVRPEELEYLVDREKVRT
jgi:hypothetical protein